MHNIYSESYESLQLIKEQDYIRITSGKSLKKFRTNFGDTQSDLAKFLQITKSTISKYESGKIEIPLSLLPFISARYNISISNFFDETPYNYHTLDTKPFLDMVNSNSEIYKCDKHIQSKITLFIAKYIQNYMSTTNANSFDTLYTLSQFLEHIKITYTGYDDSLKKDEQIADIYRCLYQDIDRIFRNDYTNNSSLFYKEILHKYMDIFSS